MRYLLALFLPGLMMVATLQAFSKASAASEFSSTDDCGFVENIYNKRLSWKGELPIKLSIHESVPKNMIPAIERAISTWKTSTGVRLFEIVQVGKAGSKDLGKIKDGTNTIYWYGKGEWKGDKDDQAKTVISWVGDKIDEANILINGDSVSFYTDVATGLKQVDLQSVMLHELGHVLGLKHNDSRPGIMATYLKENSERRQILTADLDSVRCEY
jgi:hypothetical protein